MEKALTERVDNQAEDRDLAARTANRSNRKVRKVKAAVAVAARVKAGVAVADKDKAVARDAVAVAVKTVDTETSHALPRTQTRR
jgi:hypothetical protein